MKAALHSAGAGTSPGAKACAQRDARHPVEDRVTALLLAGDHAAAAALLSPIAHSGPHGAWFLLQRAMIAYADGALPDAIALAWRATRLSPSDPGAEALLADCLARSGHEAQALDHLERAASLDPLNPTLRRRLAAHVGPTRRERARQHLAAFAEMAGPADLPRAQALARTLQVPFIARAWQETDRIRAWAAASDRRAAGPLQIRLTRLSRGLLRTDLVEMAAPGDSRDAGTVAALDLPWPAGAEAVWLEDVETGVPIAGCPLYAAPRPVDTPVRTPTEPATRPSTGPDRAGAAPAAVVIPVFKTARLCRLTIESVIAGRGAVPYEIIVIDDATPDPALRRMLIGFAESGLIRLFVNRRNLGFTASANRGIVQAGARDVVLLNADTMVPAGWLDRLARAAHAAPDIATVTPLTNNGQIVSHPAPFRGAPCPDRAGLERLDRAAAQENAGAIVDLPTGVGFCLYIRRTALAETGLLDAAAFGRGYGEETDFCLRASARGWRHVCAADLFVAHQGGASFGAEKARLVRQNMPRVAARHPGYHALMDRFLADDPLRPMRRAIERATLRAPEPAGRPVLLLGPPGWRRSPELDARRAAAAAVGRPLLCLSPMPGEAGCTVTLEREGADGDSNLVYRLPGEGPELLADLRRLDPISVEIFADHLPPGLVDLAAETGLEMIRVEPSEGDDGLGGPGELSCPGRGRPAGGEVPEPAEGLALAVASGADTPQGAAWLLRLARALAPQRARSRLFVLQATALDLALQRTGCAFVLGPVPADEHADLARALGCSAAMVLLGPGQAAAPRLAAAAHAAPAVIRVDLQPPNDEAAPGARPAWLHTVPRGLEPPALVDWFQRRFGQPGGRG